MAAPTPITTTMAAVRFGADTVNAPVTNITPMATSKIVANMTPFSMKVGIAKNDDCGDIGSQPPQISLLRYRLRLDVKASQLQQRADIDSTSHIGSQCIES